MTEADRLREAAREILTGREFQPPDDSVLDRLWGWITDRSPDLPGALSSDWFEVVIALVAVTAVALALRRVGRRRAVRRGPRSATTGRMARSDVASATWRQRANEASAAGQWKEALRCEHRYVVASLDEAGLLVERDHRTAGELLADVRNVQDVHAGLGDITDAFEGAWYGGREADAVGVDAVRQVGDAVIDAGQAS